MAAKFVAPLAVAGVLVACSFEPVLTTKFVDYNRAFEDSSNSILLLNVLRAKDRKPLYFTTVSQFNPTIGGSGELTLSIPLNPTAYTNLGIGTRGSINTSNTATVVTEHTHEFMRGFLQPISIELFDYFWQQGWPRDLLLHLFVYKIEIVPPPGKKTPASGRRKEVKATQVRVYVNAPSTDRLLADDDEDPKNLDCTSQHESTNGRVRFACFQKLARMLELLMRFSAADAGKDITREVPAPGIRDWKVLVDAAKPDSKLQVVYDSKKKTVKIRKSGAGIGLCIADPLQEDEASYHRRSSALACPKKGDTSSVDEGSTVRVGVSGVDKAQLVIALNAAMRDRDAKKAGPTGEGPTDKRTREENFEKHSRRVEVLEAYSELNRLCGEPSKEENCQIIIHLRSPEAMIYYLGEATRALEGPKVGTVLLRKIVDGDQRQRQDITTCGPNEKSSWRYLALLVLEHSRGTETTASVTYNGDRYVIPKSGCHRSMQALSLVSIILGLHRRATDLPRTSTVNVVGP